NHEQLTPDALIFIGDTPNDVACAKSIGARCLIVLDGSSYQRADFEECRPWKIIDALPDDPAQLEAMFNE
ncbi:HAD hydrolase-like protein, partial [Acinetobacter baumannii]|nr:HAD hydrolase-like protein [Acinetobacter baumannii]